MTNEYVIKCTFFANHQSVDSGSAISLKDANAMIFGNNFYNCSTSNVGGAIYTYNCIAIFINNIFKSCYDKHVDASFGNALRSDQGKSNFSLSSTSACGPSQVNCGDSPVVFLMQTCNVEFYNSSFSFGLNGGSIGVYDTKENSRLVFSQVLHCKGDWSMLEIHNVLSVKNINFVDDSQISPFSIESNNDMTAYSINFFDCSKPLRNVKLVDSYSNIPYNDLTLTKNYSIIEFIISTNCSITNEFIAMKHVFPFLVSSKVIILID